MMLFFVSKFTPDKLLIFSLHLLQQLCRANLYAVGVGAFFFIQGGQLMYAVHYAIQSPQFLLLDVAYVCTWGNKCKMLMLPYSEPCTCELGLRITVAHVNCGNCRTTLVFPYGAPSVKCAICHYVTNVGISNVRVPIPVHRRNGTISSGMPPSSSSQSQTVVVENPMSVDESGKLVSNVVVGVTTDKSLSPDFPLKVTIHC
ncbi:vacuolar protein sorting-associated protein 2-like protein 2 [Cucumis melo var. makuwa]|uniref:Vacuolar protein sorting-associated protein 2-like protein 2 n=1 Tax=Cucumis melo var. makuwa TaxID=1194695 RepID=A0A5D3CPK2_CUCMM|nr:vacuolar protein sorting-associated protein 2-like protein 2 [Cucumis melo var. makuwa]